MVGLQTILVDSIEKECPSGRTISIGADTLDLKEISAQRAETNEALGHDGLNFRPGVKRSRGKIVMVPIWGLIRKISPSGVINIRKIFIYLFY